jgi:hypothetical protein
MAAEIARRMAVGDSHAADAVQTLHQQHGFAAVLKAGLQYRSQHCHVE